MKLITSSLVKVNDKIISKSNYLVSDTDDIEIISNDKLKYVSRGGLKLEKALKEFNINVNKINAMDIGSSTGGFCDCLLKSGVNHVTAIDVGTNLLHESLRNNPRISLFEQTNFKQLEHSFFINVDLITCDVSFISLIRVIEKVASENVKVDMVCLIKPQFECGIEVAKKYKGVILNKDIHKMIIDNTILKMNLLGFYVKGICSSPIKGGDGNIEYVCYISNKINENVKVNTSKLVKEAFK